jgi:hypothetical protein
MVFLTSSLQFSCLQFSEIDRVLAPLAPLLICLGFSFCSANRGLADLRATGCLIEGLPSTEFDLFIKKYSRANDPCQEEIIKINKKTRSPFILLIVGGLTRQALGAVKDGVCPIDGLKWSEESQIPPPQWKGSGANARRQGKFSSPGKIFPPPIFLIVQGLTPPRTSALRSQTCRRVTRLRCRLQKGEFPLDT